MLSIYQNKSEHYNCVYLHPKVWKNGRIGTGQDKDKLMIQPGKMGCEVFSIKTGLGRPGEFNMGLEFI